MNGKRMDQAKLESGSIVAPISSQSGCANLSTQAAHVHGELPRRIVVHDDVLGEILMCFSASRTLDEVINLLNQ